MNGPLYQSKQSFHLPFSYLFVYELYECELCCYFQNTFFIRLTCISIVLLKSEKPYGCLQIKLKLDHSIQSFSICSVEKGGKKITSYNLAQII